MYTTTNSGDGEKTFPLDQQVTSTCLLKNTMAPDYATQFWDYYPQIKHPLKWILTYSNTCKNSEDSSTLGSLLARGDTIKKMSTPITRTNFKQQLQRQQLEQQDQLYQMQKQSLPADSTHSQGIPVPRTASPTTVPPDVPTSVLQVKTILNFFFKFFVCFTLPNLCLFMKNKWH